MLLDTTYEIATPEGVELHLPLAGLAPRSFAWLIDAVIKSVALSIAGIGLAAFGNFGAGLFLLVSFLLLWFYNVLFEVLRDGATPGKKYIGLSVMNLNGTPVGWSGSLIRNLIRVVDLLPGCYAFGCVSVLTSGKFQRLGDLAAGTVVVHRTDEAERSPANEVEALPVKVPLSRSEQQAIVTFRERATQLNPERAEELAAILGPVFGGTVDSARLQAYASWLAGQHRRQ